MLTYLCCLLATDVLGLPFWFLLAALAFLWLVDWGTGGRLSH